MTGKTSISAKCHNNNIFACSCICENVLIGCSISGAGVGGGLRKLKQVKEERCQLGFSLDKGLLIRKSVLGQRSDDKRLDLDRSEGNSWRLEE